MFLARLALATVVDEAAAKDGESCPVFTAKLKLFQKAASNNPSTVDLKEITDQQFEVINALGSPVMQGEQIIVGQGVDERWFTLPRAHPKIQFVTQGKIADRAVAVKVLRTMNGPPNLDSQSIGDPLQYGDTLTIYDPFNLWSDIEPGATGWAYLAYAQQDDITTSGITETHVARYEIEECSLPVSEIKATLKTCLMGGMTTGVAEVAIDSGNIRSAYPNVDHPPSGEIVEGSGGTQEITFQNTWKLDGIANSECVLRRITNLQTSEPENYAAPKARSSTTAEWQIVSVEKKVARHIAVTYNGGQWTSTAHYDGFPVGNTSSECQENIQCFHCDCLDNGDIGYAFLDTTASQPNYVVYSTNSAFFGSPDDVTLITESLDFDGCTLNYQRTPAKVLCKLDPVADNTSLPTTTLSAVTGSTLSIVECGSCTWTYTFVDCETSGNCTFTYDGTSWSSTDTCTAQCNCQESDIPENNPATGQPWEAGDTHVTSCRNVELAWVQTGTCNTGCSCTEPPDPPSPQLGDTKTAECTGAGNTDANKALCVQNGMVTFTAVICNGVPSYSTAPPSCVPIDDECPDVCQSGTETP